MYKEGGNDCYSYSHNASKDNGGDDDESGGEGENPHLKKGNKR